jgi:organic radical activating enzyme
MLCSNIIHNLSWKSNGRVNPCNNLLGFPEYTSIAEMRECPNYQQLLTDHINHVQSPYCQRCWDKESIGLNSKRITDNQLDAVYNKISPDYIKIDAAIGDVCNAACRICGPDSSTMWQKIIPTWTNLNIAPSIWDEAGKQLDHIVQLDFGGGEPWANAIPEQINLLESIIKQGNHKLVKLRYNTNGSLWPTRLIELLKNFREVEITLSLDDTESRFEYNRWPLKWSTVETNIKKFVELKSKFNIKITINFTVSVFTWQRAEEFKLWATSHGLEFINFNILHDPWVYSIKSLPDEIKKIMPATIFDNIIGTDYQPTWKETFVEITQRLDQQRNQSFENTFPELRNLL